METDRHVVFYREQGDGILVSRVLHRRTLPEKHVLEDEDEEPF
jgi:plasmid stabilization system protein ParE